MNLLEQQASNRRKTWLVMAVFVGFLLLLGFGVDLFLIGYEGPPVPIASFLALGAGGASVIGSYLAGDRAVLLSTGAVPLERAQSEAADDQDRFRLTQFANVVEEMAIAAGLPVPKTFVIPDPDPNAFATGRDPAHASIAVTRGLLDQLNRDELQAVVAHEMAHVRNYDIRLMTIVAALVGGIVLLADFTRRGLRFGLYRRAGAGRGRGNRRSGGAGALAALLFVIWLLAIVLAPILGRMLALAVSRRREYLADATAAELTRNPGALADALAKIDAAVGPTRAIKQGTAHLCIGDPLERPLDNREGWWADLFATHPPMAKRIAALRAMAFQPAR
jgi:heat shock protein HtpX